MSGLRELWGDGVPGAGELAGELEGRYTGRRRGAYRERYLRRVLTALGSLEQLCTDPVAVRLAAWFHRAEHVRGNSARADAEASARLAEEKLPAYGVSAVRVAEVARLVRLTGGAADDPGPNGVVLLDAVDSVLADPQYSNHASDLRRDAHFDLKERRQEIQEMLASERIFRIQLAHERYDAAARANLEVELELLDQLDPSPWRGWQRAGLSVLAVTSAIAATLAALLAIGQPWRLPEFRDEPKWQAIVMAVIAAATVPALWSAGKGADRRARMMTAATAAGGLGCLVIVVLNVPQATGASGVGARVPLLLITSALLVLAGLAAFAATRFTAGSGSNRGRTLAGLTACAVVILMVIFVLVPLQRSYLLSVNEHVDGDRRPVGREAVSTETGQELRWTSRGGSSSLDTVATAHGIAVSRGRGTVEMLDPASGNSRWRYIRADTDDDPNLEVLDGGRKLLVEYPDLGFFVLDADTGKRVTAWPERTRDYTVEGSDPLVTGKSVSKGSDKLYGTNLDGSNRWTYEPGRCTSISAQAAGGMVVADLGHSCGGQPDQLVGLDLETGKKRWGRDTGVRNLTAAGDVVVGIEGGEEDKGQAQQRLTAIDPGSGAVRWHSDVPRELTCSLRMVPAANRVVLLSCVRDADGSRKTIVRFVDVADGRVVSTTRTNVAAGQRYAVTPSGRVFLVGPGKSGCRLVQVTEGGGAVEQPLHRSVSCRQIFAAGELILATGRDGLVALR
ncbi:PQQ-binding-like beta-propeller repeat protein [Kribbella sp. NPDC048915]|uniref:outer membrane protein assembly factor BamB family protein n=1 Tax=Kribbella sp. NPDC048915 TaxID=3155148 RepID=UPI0033D5E234